MDALSDIGSSVSFERTHLYDAADLRGRHQLCRYVLSQVPNKDSGLLQDKDPSSAVVCLISPSADIVRKFHLSSHSIRLDLIERPHRELAERQRAALVAVDAREAPREFARIERKPMQPLPRPPGADDLRLRHRDPPCPLAPRNAGLRPRDIERHDVDGLRERRIGLHRPRQTVLTRVLRRARLALRRAWTRAFLCIVPVGCDPERTIHGRTRIGRTE